MSLEISDETEDSDAKESEKNIPYSEAYNDPDSGADPVDAVEDTE